MMDHTKRDYPKTVDYQIAQWICGEYRVSTIIDTTMGLVGLLYGYGTTWASYELNLYILRKGADIR